MFLCSVHRDNCHPFHVRGAACTWCKHMHLHRSCLVSSYLWRGCCLCNTLQLMLKLWVVMSVLLGVSTDVVACRAR